MRQSVSASPPYIFSTSSLLLIPNCFSISLRPPFSPTRAQQCLRSICGTGGRMSLRFFRKGMSKLEPLKVMMSLYLDNSAFKREKSRLMPRIMVLVRRPSNRPMTVTPAGSLTPSVSMSRKTASSLKSGQSRQVSVEGSLLRKKAESPRCNARFAANKERSKYAFLFRGKPLM